MSFMKRRVQAVRAVDCNYIKNDFAITTNIHKYSPVYTKHSPMPTIDSLKPYTDIHQLTQTFTDVHKYPPMTTNI